MQLDAGRQFPRRESGYTRMAALARPRRQNPDAPRLGRGGNSNPTASMNSATAPAIPDISIFLRFPRLRTEAEIFFRICRPPVDRSPEPPPVNFTKIVSVAKSARERNFFGRHFLFFQQNADMFQPEVNQIPARSRSHFPAELVNKLVSGHFCPARQFRKREIRGKVFLHICDCLFKGRFVLARIRLPCLNQNNDQYNEPRPQLEMMLFHTGPAERFMHLIQQIAHIQENGSEQSKQ